MPSREVQRAGGPAEFYLYIYNKLTSNRSIENLLLEINKIINKDVTKAKVFKKTCSLVNEAAKSYSAPGITKEKHKETAELMKEWQNGLTEYGNYQEFLPDEVKGPIEGLLKEIERNVEIIPIEII